MADAVAEAELLRRRNRTAEWDGSSVHDAAGVRKHLRNMVNPKAKMDLHRGRADAVLSGQSDAV